MMMIIHNPQFVIENETSLEFLDTNGSSNLGQTIIRNDSQQQDQKQKKKRTCRIVNFAVLADYRVKLKKGKKIDKYLDFVRELKKLWNMRVTVIPVVVGTHGTIPKGL